MTRMLLSIAALSLLAAQPSLARPLAPGCNPAIQNWVNGSGDTCPFNSNTLVKEEKTETPVYTPPETVDEEPVE